MNKIIFKNYLRSIKKSYIRVIALFLLSLISVFVFCGFVSVYPDFMYTFDEFIDEGNAYDVRIVSNYGFSKDDEDYIKSLDSVYNSEGVKDTDAIWLNDNVSPIINVSSIPNTINTLTLVDGRMPTSKGEMVVETSLLELNNVKIGDTITIGDTDNLKLNEFKIVGSVRNSVYYSNMDYFQNRGSSKLGNGTINYVTYVLDDNFTFNYFTSIYITVKGNKELVPGSLEYEKNIIDFEKILNNIKEDREKVRYDSVYLEMEQIINDKSDELNNEISSKEKELESAKKELDNGKKLLDNTKLELDKANNKLYESKKLIDKAEAEINNFVKEYNINLNDLDNIITNKRNEYLNVYSELKKYTLLDEEYYDCYQRFYTIKLEVEALEELDSKYDLLNNSKKEYSKGLNTYNTNYSNYVSKLSEYNDNLKLYNDSYDEFLSKKEDLLAEIEKARNTLDDIEEVKWYVFDKNDTRDYNGFLTNVNGLKKLTLVFPILFYFIALLVSSLSVGRMIKDDYKEIGILKSLGFNNKSIRNKYMLFTLIPTLVGGIIGTYFGIKYIPPYVADMYQLAISLPFFHIYVNPLIIIIGNVLSILCICGSSFYIINKTLKYNGSYLMKSEMPIEGKRVILEKVSFIWNRLSSSMKITVRNILRYRKRSFLIMIGVLGCSLLMFIGFSIKDTVYNLSRNQYYGVFHFGGVAYTEEMDDDTYKSIFDDKNITNSIRCSYNSVDSGKNNIRFVVFDDIDNINNFMELKDYKTGKDLKFEDNKVIISHKLAKILNINVGDKISFNSLDKDYEFVVSGITENYYFHYVYANRETLENSGFDYKENAVIFNIRDLNDKEHDKLFNKIISYDEVMGIDDVVYEMRESEIAFKVIDKVVYFLIILSAIFGFITLYCLSSINIYERKREITNLKLLGYKNSYIDKYILIENDIISLVGYVLGCIIGTIIIPYLLKGIELDVSIFKYIFNFKNYIYVLGIVFVFVFIINIIIHFKIKNVDVIENMKSVD